MKQERSCARWHDVIMCRVGLCQRRIFRVITSIIALPPTAWHGVGRIIWAMLVIAALQENQGQPIKASHIVTDVYIKKAIKEEVMSDPLPSFSASLLVRLGIASLLARLGRCKSVGSWRGPCSTGQNCELMDPSSDLIALWKNNSSKSSSTGQFDRPPNQVRSTGQFDWPVRLDIESGSQQMTYIQWVHAEPLQLVQGTEQVLPTAMIRYMVVVLAR
jgi:hypothetical protein